jgi:phosphatidylcholine synthase
VTPRLLPSDVGTAASNGATKTPRRSSRWQQTLAWGVHAYTALGLLAAGWMAVLIVQGGHDAFRLAFLLMIFATAVDATDGTLARAVGVKKVLPGFDGAKLDDLIDFLTYTCLPLLLLWRADILPGMQGAWLMIPLLASAYGFSQMEAKTTDGYFLGFPSYWNIVAFYVYVLQLPAWGTILFLVIPALLTFVPSRYLYPTRKGRWNWLANGLGALWTCLLAWIVWSLPRDRPPGEESLWLAVGSLLYPAFYLAASWVVSVNYWRRRD